MNYVYPLLQYRSKYWYPQPNYQEQDCAVSCTVQYTQRFCKQFMPHIKYQLDGVGSTEQTLHDATPPLWCRIF